MKWQPWHIVQRGGSIPAESVFWYSVCHTCTYKSPLFLTAFQAEYQARKHATLMHGEHSDPESTIWDE